MRKPFSSVAILFAYSLSAQSLNFSKNEDQGLLPIAGHPLPYYENVKFQISGIDGAVILLDSPKMPTAPSLANNGFAKDVQILLQQPVSQPESGTEKETL